MQVNHVPKYDMSKAKTGCCPQFEPAEWDDKTFVFKDKQFVKVQARCIMHVPLNLGGVITKTWAAIEKAGAKDDTEFIMLTKDVSPWKSEQFFWAAKEVPNLDNIKLSGTFKTKVFEGDYKEAKDWYKEMMAIGQKSGSKNPEVYFYYTTCPKCAKVYGKNYTVGFVKI